MMACCTYKLWDEGGASGGLSNYLIYAYDVVDVNPRKVLPAVAHHVGQSELETITLNKQSFSSIDNATTDLE